MGTIIFVDIREKMRTHCIIRTIVFIGRFACFVRNEIHSVGDVGSISSIATRKHFATFSATTGRGDFIIREQNASPDSTRSWRSSEYFQTRLLTAATRSISTENATTRSDLQTISRLTNSFIKLTKYINKSQV